MEEGNSFCRRCQGEESVTAVRTAQSLTHSTQTLSAEGVTRWVRLEIRQKRWILLCVCGGGVLEREKEDVDEGGRVRECERNRYSVYHMSVCEKEREMEIYRERQSWEESVGLETSTEPFLKAVQENKYEVTSKRTE